MDSKARYVANYADKVSSRCRICNKESGKTYQLYQSYFSLFGFLPLFPLRKKVYWSCESCSVVKELKTGVSKTLDNFEEEIATNLKAQHNSQSDIRNYWGSILILLLIAFVVYLVNYA